eukprot:1213131-Prymnesium_polylepis.1
MRAPAHGRMHGRIHGRRDRGDVEVQAAVVTGCLLRATFAVLGVSLVQELQLVPRVLRILAHLAVLKPHLHPQRVVMVALDNAMAARGVLHFRADRIRLRRPR